MHKNPKKLLRTDERTKDKELKQKTLENQRINKGLCTRSGT